MYYIRWALISLAFVAAIGIFIFKDEIFQRKLTPSQIEQYNQFVLQEMEQEETKAGNDLQRDRAYNDCVRAAISRHESPSTYYQSCYKEGLETGN